MNGNPKAICPDLPTLKAFSVGDCPEDQAASILEHLDGCSQCLAAVEDFSRREGILLLVRQVDRDLQELLAEPGFRDTEAKLQALSTTFCRDQSTESDVAAGEAWIGRYQLVATIGQGGMGTVYKAIHADLKKPFAVKILPPQFAEHGMAVQRFRREMEALGILDHPHVVSAVNAGEDNGRLYLVMEYVRGVDLATVLRRLGPLPPVDACEIIRQAALGVQAIHQRGLVHRDLKPSNLMLVHDGTVKVLDLGLARYLAGEEEIDLTAAGQCVGTRRYMAPEQRLSSRVDARADLYSLAASLWALLTGEAPPGPQQVAPNEGVCSKGQAQGTGGSMVDRDKIPAALRPFLRRALANEPGERFATAGQFIEALEPFCQGSDLPSLAVRAMGAEEPVTSPPPEPPIRGRRSPRRGLLLLLAMLTVALPAVVLVATRPGWDARSGSSASGQSAQAQPTQRAVAEWVLSKGGSVKPHHHPVVTGAADLPAGTFLVQAVDFYDVKQIHDADLLPLLDLPHLQSLNLSRTSVTSQCAPTLGRLVSLRFLYLNYTGINDTALPALASLPKLELLSLKHTGISDRGLVHLADMPHLTWLDLSGTRITDQGLAHLASLPALRSLLLSQTAVTGEGLQNFRCLDKLKTLDLSETRITDAQLGVLERAVRLERLVVSGTAITQQGVARLQRALPECQIIR